MCKDVFNGSDEVEVIHSYLRKDAIADGVLVDVTKVAREAGFRYPVALTHAVNELCVKVPDGVHGQDECGRLWDILVMLAYCCRTEGAGGIRFFKVLVQNDNIGARAHRLKAVFHHGDEGEPVITIMLPHED